MGPPTDTAAPLVLGPAGLDRLVRVLAETHRVIGPTVADGAVVLREIASAAELPDAWIDEQEGGRYRLHADASAGPFDHVVGPWSLKNFLFPPRETVAVLERGAEGWESRAPEGAPRALAVIGVRGCDLAALAIQDRVFLGNGHVDPAYAARRRDLFLVAVDCRRAAPTCFCHSTDSGPAACDAEAGRGADLALVDLGPGPTGSAAEDLGIAPSAARRFACRPGTPRGAALLARLAAEGLADPLAPADAALADAIPRATAARLAARGRGERSLDTDGLRDLLFSRLDHPRWDDVASRCLSCTNCTLVCPTCFCASVTEIPSLDADRVERERRWESCFSLDHSRMHGRSVRHSTASRYRQWLTHKLAGWIDQFGVSGCTGCGRCITWCPVGIDLTAEVAALRATPPDAPGGHQ